MSRRTRMRDKTRNFHHHRLIIRFPGKPDRHYTHSDKALCRKIRDKFLKRGAEVEEQVHEGFGVYRTRHVYSPAGSGAEADR